VAEKAQQVRALLTVRRLRLDIFGSELFGEPAWDMLLALYEAHLEQRALSKSSLHLASMAPWPTALRWMDRLECRQLLKYHRDPHDARRTLVELSEDGLKSMERYWSQWAEIMPFQTDQSLTP